MVWHDIRDPQDPKLDALAPQYNLHPLHIEDCRHRNQNAKIEAVNDYLFVVLKPIEMDEECVITVGDLDFFLGKDYLITVQETKCSSISEALDRAHGMSDKARPDQLFHRLVDALVDSYYPIIDRLLERVDAVEDEALESPDPTILQRILDMRRALVEIRRVLANTRDVIGNIQRERHELISEDLAPFWRDVYDHTARNLDRVELQRETLIGITEIYLSSVSNRTNQVMKVLTVFGTLATPALIITGIYGMNLKHLPFADSPHATGIVIGLIAGVSILMLVIFRKLRWF